jgi:hypothetical protein
MIWWITAPCTIYIHATSSAGVVNSSKQDLDYCVIVLQLRRQFTHNNDVHCRLKTLKRRLTLKVWYKMDTSANNTINTRDLLGHDTIDGLLADPSHGCLRSIHLQ